MENKVFRKYFLILVLGFLLSLVLHILCSFYINLRAIQVREYEAQASYKITEDNNEELKYMLKFFENMVNKFERDD